MRPCALSRSAAVWSSCTYAGRLASAATASSFAPGFRRSSSCGRARARRRSTPRSPSTCPGSSASSRRPPRRRLGLDRLTLTAEQGRREARARDLADRPVGGRRARRHLRAHHAARPAQPLGLVLDERHAQLQLAARARAARRARLRRRARGLPPRRAQPRPGVLGARREAPPRLRRVEGVARRARLGDPRLPAARSTTAA